MIKRFYKILGGWYMKKVLIIGGGISGLTAGIFAQKSGFQSVIYEKNNILGGECTGCDRQGYHIDGCIQWLTGTKEGTNLNNLWKDVGALGNVKIHKLDSFLTVEYEGTTINIYRDLELLKEHLIEISIEDKHEIEELCNNIKKFEDFVMPSEKPFDLMTLSEVTRLAMNIKPYSKVLKVMTEITVEEYSTRFKSPAIRKALNSIIPSHYYAAALLFTLSTFTSGNGDIPYGGSRAMAKRMEEKYLCLGGKVRTNSKVHEILIENGVARGIQLVNGIIEYGEYIVPTCDVRVTFDKLLAGKYEDKRFLMRYSNPDIYPLSSCAYVALAVDKDISEYPKKLLFEVIPFTCGQNIYTEIEIFNYCHESFAPKGKSIIISKIMTNEADYLFWKDKYKDYNKYKEEKINLANNIIERIEERFPELQEKVTMLDVATPLTYEHYCGAYQGAWMSFVTTPKGKQLMHNGKLKGVKNLFMAGQWLMSPGGLSCALVTGKWAIQRICKKENIEFKFNKKSD